MKSLVFIFLLVPAFSFAQTIRLASNRCQMIISNFDSLVERQLSEGSYEKKTFLYATPWSFAESMVLLRNLPDTVDVKSLDRKTAYTLSAAVVHSWNIAEKIFSPELIEWALLSYSSLDMSWVHLREKFAPKQNGPRERLFIHNPKVEQAYGVKSERIQFAARFKSFSIEKQTLDQILKKYWSPNVQFSDKRAEGFGVETHVLEKDGALFEEGWLLEWREVPFKLKAHQKRYNIGFDSPFGFVLKYEGEPLAVTSFDVIGDALFLNHIQGVRAKLFEQTPQGTLEYVRNSDGSLFRAPPNSNVGKILLRPLLIELVKTAARALGYKKVIIQQAQSNKWIVPHGLEMPDMSLERAQATYDNTARELGAYQDSQGNWVIEVN
jgi:hypothetical protein